MCTRVQLNLDQDGPLADFRSGFVKRINAQPDFTREISDEEWEKINAAGDFYESLPLAPGADVLIDHCRKYRPRILTKAHKLVPNAAEQKHAWLTKHFGADNFDIAVVEDKTPYAPIDNVLVDDSVTNCAKWMHNRGHAVLHTSADRSIRRLQRLGFV